MKLKTSFLETPTRNKIAVYSIYNSPENLAVFLCHGISYSCIPAFFTTIEGISFAEHLAKEGFNVYACDYLGYGKSQLFEAENEVTVQTSLESVEISIDYFMKKDGLKKLNILGWSWGAQVAGLYSAKHSDDIIKLILYGFKWHFSRWNKQGFEFNLDEKRKKHDLSFIRSDFTNNETIIPEALENYIQQIMLIDPDSPNSPRQEILAHSFFIHPEKIICPTMLIYGTDDRTIDEKDLDLFYKRLSCKDKKIIKVFGGHAIHLEKGYSNFLNLIVEFMST
ncbi:alpha/beta hydrolase [Desulfosporosinus sp. PR]|uniref:alpha/beta hydrolase n=1 Tax=Candidatus Desulfosporosinus nitrosoreducens TaxID=3401928 RepID=UPI0027E9C8DE|nr:alpha/beta hydrolase [Desulfosporosinus sp. PR]MDQ7094865.1 alpha/beta hydrolase [Desulfosporosinus sp. PR]